MNNSRLSLQLKLIVCTLISVTLAMPTSEDESEKNVIILTDANFNEKISTLETTLVFFLAPWCGFCKRLAPQFAEAATILKNDEPHPISLAKIDCTNEGRATCIHFGVHGYPTMKIFRKGNLRQAYKGQRVTQGIVDYMRNAINRIIEDEKAEL